MHYLAISHYVVQVLFGAYCNIVFTSHKGGGTGWGGVAKAPPIFDRRFVRIISCFTASHASPPNCISVLPPLTNHTVSLRCAGSQDAFHCYGAPLHCCTTHAPALMEVCVRTCMCSLNSFPLICVHHWNHKQVYMCVVYLASFPGSPGTRIYIARRAWYLSYVSMM